MNKSLGLFLKSTGGMRQESGAGTRWSGIYRSWVLRDFNTREQWK